MNSQCFVVVSVLLATFSKVIGRPEIHRNSHEIYNSYSTPPKYAYEYGVKDDYYGSNFGHQESRDNDVTKGTYYVHLPDGRIQKVTYYVDGYSGYVAEVSYEGEAIHPKGKVLHDDHSFESKY